MVSVDEVTGERVCGVRMPEDVWCVGLRADGPDPLVRVTAAFIHRPSRQVALISAACDVDAPVGDGPWTWTSGPDGFSPTDRAACAQVVSNVTAGACVGTFYGLPPADYATMVRAYLRHGDLEGVDEVLTAVLDQTGPGPVPVWQITPPPGPTPEVSSPPAVTFSTPPGPVILPDQPGPGGVGGFEPGL